MAEQAGQGANLDISDFPESNGPANANRESVRSGAESPALLRVLVIDDDAFIRRLLERLLGFVAGFDVTVTSSAMQGLALLQSGHHDVILSDAIMPDMNGRAFCAAVRDLGGPFATMPIMILSAASAEDLGWEDLLGPCIGWLCKPFQPGELVGQVVDLVERARASRSREPSISNGPRLHNQS